MTTSTSSLALTDVAALVASYTGQARVKDPAARALAKLTKDNAKRDALLTAQRRAESFVGYTASQLERIASLRAVHWPRARAIRDAASATRELIRKHGDVHDDYAMDTATYHDAIVRECRLTALVSRAYAASAAMGRFPICRADMRTDKRTAFLGSAAARHFTFKGGRDIGTLLTDPADIVQGAFIRALENGDTVNGVPTYGSMFRHIQAERAHLTRVANLEYVSARDSALGHVSRVVETWPEMTDKHVMRLVGTRNHGTLEDHRLAIALAHRDAELAMIDDTVTNDARTSALVSGKAEEFHVVVARVLMGGATLTEIADAMGLRVQTVKDKTVASASASLRITESGIDHSQRSADMAREAERERAIDAAEAEHAATLRARRIAAETVHYAMGRVA